MKTPEEYVDAQCAGPERPAKLTHEQATAAVRQALLDAERYKDNLLGALRRADSPQAAEVVLALLGESEEPARTVVVGGRELPWRVATTGDSERPKLTPNPTGEEPPF